jgi:WD40 repeat protein
MKRLFCVFIVTIMFSCASKENVTQDKEDILQYPVDIGTTWTTWAYIYDVAYSPNGKMLAMATNVGTIDVWDMESGQRIKTCEVEPSDPQKVGFSPDNKKLIYSYGKRIYVRDIENDETVSTIGINGGSGRSICSPIFSPDGEFIAAYSDTILYVWYADTGEIFYEFRGDSYFFDFAFHPDGKIIAANAGNNRIKLYDLQNKNILWSKVSGHKSELFYVMFSPDGKRIVSGAGETGSKPEKTIILWDAKTGDELSYFYEADMSVSSIMFSPNGKYILASDEGQRCIVVFNGETGSKIHTMMDDIFPRGAYYSPDGKYIIEQLDRSVVLLNAVSGVPIIALRTNERLWLCNTMDGYFTGSEGVYKYLFAEKGSGENYTLLTESNSKELNNPDKIKEYILSVDTIN